MRSTTSHPQLMHASRPLWNKGIKFIEEYDTLGATQIDFLTSIGPAAHSPVEYALRSLPFPSMNREFMTQKEQCLYTIQFVHFGGKSPLCRKYSVWQRFQHLFHNSTAPRRFLSFSVRISTPIRKFGGDGFSCFFPMISAPLFNLC